MGISAVASLTAATNAQSLDKSTSCVKINGRQARALMDSGSSQSFINPQLVKLRGLPIYPSSGTVSLASASQSAQIQGNCTVNLALMGRQYNNVRLYVLPSLCADLILGLVFQTQHQSVTLNYGGKEAPLNLVCRLSSLNVKPSELFVNLTADCHPIASKSRRYSFADRQFIEKETKRLLKEGIIEKSNSPWRAQVVVKDTHVQGKKRLAIDYTQTINRFTLLDAYPLPRIDETVNKISNFVSTVLLISEVPIIRFQSNQKTSLIRLLRLQVDFTSLQECLLESLMV